MEDAGDGPDGDDQDASPLTLTDAARELEVHYMTAYRYVRQGMLVAAKAGGVWWVERDELAAFRARRGRGEGNGNGARRPRGSAPWGERLERRLLVGDEAGAWSLIEAAIDGGTDVQDVYLSLLAPALVSIGERWHRGEIDIAAEHMATGTATRLISRLGARCTHRGRSRGTVVLGAPRGEEHSMPLMMLSDIVRCAGFDVCDLGSNTPTESFVQVATGLDAVVAVGLSVFTAARRTEATATLAALRGALGERAVLFAGGAAVRDLADARALGADEWAPDAKAFVATLGRVLEDRARARRDKGA